MAVKSFKTLTLGLEIIDETKEDVQDRTVKD
jgi:hypothetical protein